MKHVTRLLWLAALIVSVGVQAAVAIAVPGGSGSGITFPNNPAVFLRGDSNWVSISTTAAGSVLTDVGLTGLSATNLYRTRRAANLPMIPQEFGAVGDGVTDDTTALAAMFSVATTGYTIAGITHYPKILIPRGVYRYSGPISIAGNGGSGTLSIRGEGAQQSQLLWTPTDYNQTALAFSSGGKYMSLEGFSLVCDWATAYGDMRSNGATGISTGDRADKSRISDVFVSGFGKGMFVDGYHFTFEKVWLQSCRIGASFSQWNSSSIRDVYIIGCETPLYYYGGTGAGEMLNVLTEGCMRPMAIQAPNGLNVLGGWSELSGSPWMDIWAPEKNGVMTVQGPGFSGLSQNSMTTIAWNQYDDTFSNPNLRQTFMEQGDKVTFTAHASLPAAVTAGTEYYIVSADWSAVTKNISTITRSANVGTIAFSAAHGLHVGDIFTLATQNTARRQTYCLVSTITDASTITFSYPGTSFTSTNDTGVVYFNRNSYQISATPGGAAIDIASSGSGGTATRNYTSNRHRHAIRSADASTEHIILDLPMASGSTAPMTVGDQVVFYGVGSGQIVPAGLTAGTVYYVTEVGRESSGYGYIIVSATSGGSAVNITADKAGECHVAVDDTPRGGSAFLTAWGMKSFKPSQYFANSYTAHKALYIDKESSQGVDVGFQVGVGGATTQIDAIGWGENYAPNTFPEQGFYGYEYATANGVGWSVEDMTSAGNAGHLSPTPKALKIVGTGADSTIGSLRGIRLYLNAETRAVLKSNRKVKVAALMKVTGATLPTRTAGNVGVKGFNGSTAAAGGTLGGTYAAPGTNWTWVVGVPMSLTDASSQSIAIEPVSGAYTFTKDDAVYVSRLMLVDAWVNAADIVQGKVRQHPCASVAKGGNFVGSTASTSSILNSSDIQSWPLGALWLNSSASDSSANMMAMVTTAGMAYNPGAWTASQNYSLGTFKRSVAGTKLLQVIVDNGSSGSGAEPTWPTTLGDTVVDSGLTWAYVADVSGTAATTAGMAYSTSAPADPLDPSVVTYVTTMPMRYGYTTPDPWPWIWTATASGTQSTSGAGTAGLPTAHALSSAAGANSGGHDSLVVTSFLLQGQSERFDAVTSIRSTANTTAYIGFHDSINEADPVDGCYFKISGTTLSGVASSNSSRTSTADASNTYTITQNTIYRLRVVVNSSSLATFTVYSTGGSQLWTGTVNANIPTGAGRGVGAGYTITQASGGPNTLCYIWRLSAKIPGLSL